METEQPEPVTRLLQHWATGNKDCLDQLLPIVDTELRRIARRNFGLERSPHTLQTTALINEAYLRLVHATEIKAEHRAQLFCLAAQIMRHILVDHARCAHRDKRGGGMRSIAIDEVAVVHPQKSAELLALDEALSRLADIDAREAKVVELRYFGSMEVEEVAAALQVHPNTVVRDWKLAKAWLKREVAGAEIERTVQDAT